MIDPRFTVTGLRDGTVEVSWTEGDRLIVARLDDKGALVTSTLLSLPIRKNGDRYGANGLAVPVRRNVDPARPTYASVLSVVRQQWPAIWSEVERQRAEGVERMARLKYKAECELFVERVGILSAMAAARVAMQLTEGRDLDSLKLEIRSFLEEWGAND